MPELLQEEKSVSLADLKVKVLKLDGYIKRAERRVALLEKKLAKVAEKLRFQNALLKKQVMA
ncbi:MAG TPA: hypothetical protein VMT55_00585 [Candidatus Sulfotelmatobacter sp.]|nr:hypothetical protein [Candidatus Sulfotelmatobacter sp.]